jgi:hypothetical protein
MPSPSVERHAAFVADQPNRVETCFFKGISLPVSCEKKLSAFGIVIAEQQKSSGPDYRPCACKKLWQSAFVPNLVCGLHRDESVNLPKGEGPFRFLEISDHKSDALDPIFKMFCRQLMHGRRKIESGVGLNRAASEYNVCKMAGS